MTILQQSSLNETGFNAYTCYLALKRHFTSSYDYFKYNGKVNASWDSYLVRKDAFIFQRIGKQKDYQNLILSNIVDNPKLWAGNLLDDAAKEKYLNWKKKQDTITYHVKGSLAELKDDFSSNFMVKDGQHPYLISLYMQSKISLETFTILVKLTKSKEYWEENIKDRVVFPDIMKKTDKYHPFLIYPEEKIKKVINEHFFE